MGISVIIPMYNAAATLDRCLSSILEQSYRDIQVVIVDDGSEDGSLAIAKGYADRDARCTVIKSDHRGTGAARNLGLSRAVGEYAVYMDADDYWVRSDLLQELADRIEKQPADVYMYQMVKVTEGGAILERFNKPPFVSAGVVLPLGDVYQDLVRDGQTLASACNKCVRRRLLTENSIRFREDVLGEDIDWVLQLFSYVNTICLMNTRAYAYTQHRTPSRSTRSDAPNDLVAIMREWSIRLEKGDASHPEAVAGVIAFEYGICMGSHHLLSAEKKRFVRRSTHLLAYGMDRKTLLIRRFCNVFGYHMTCAAVRLYLWIRRIW